MKKPSFDKFAVRDKLATSSETRFGKIFGKKWRYIYL